jgi:hypothetical protein
MKHFDRLYNNIVNESAAQEPSGQSIGDMIYDLITSLDEHTFNTYGASVKDELGLILDELNEIVDVAERHSDSEGVLELVRKLKMD